MTVRSHMRLSILVLIAVILSIKASKVTTSPADAVQMLDHDIQQLWSADHEPGDFSQWTAQGGGIFNTGTGQAGINSTVAHSGRSAASLTVTTGDGASHAVRIFRWKEARESLEAYYSAWYYFPQRVDVTAWWNVMQWKSNNEAGGSDLVYMLNIRNRSTGEMYFALHDRQNNKSYRTSPLNIPVGRWVHVEAFYKKSNTDTGQVTIWQDGEQIYDIQNVRTVLNDDFNGGGVGWSINSYTDGLSPSTVTIYADEAVISRTRVGP